ncbi:MAG: hypothetical protein KatS3mg108_1627 [Isosphaeraceae bacterium]|nr:MAG: hypothetical protein KatS3mg108_1627 [Isosphaeraceae bacterium]
MVHYTCDLCARSLGNGSDPRFVITITAEPAHDPNRLTDGDLDADALEDLAQALKQDATAAEPVPDRIELRYDLCPDCHARFTRDPLRCGTVPGARFSPN